MAPSSSEIRGADSVSAIARTASCEARQRATRSRTPRTPEPSPEDARTESRSLRRRLIGLVVAAIAIASLLLAVPALHTAVTDIGRMRVEWIAAAVALEIGSCVSFVVIFRSFFEGVSARLARRVAWVESGSGALMPGGGVTGYALGGVLLGDAGLDRRRIVVLSGGLFWLTTAINGLAIAIGALLLMTGASHGPHDFLRTGLPLLGTVAATAGVLLLALRARRARRDWQTALGEGVQEAVRTGSRPSWRLLGAVGYLLLDIAVLWCTFRALGYTPSVAALMLGYLIGYLGTLIPIPGGIGVLEGGLAAALVLYGMPATTTIAAVLVYHVIAFWVPSLGGLLAYVELRRPARSRAGARSSRRAVATSPS